MPKPTRLTYEIVPGRRGAARTRDGGPLIRFEKSRLTARSGTLNRDVYVRPDTADRFGARLSTGIPVMVQGIFHKRSERRDDEVFEILSPYAPAYVYVLTPGSIVVGRNSNNRPYATMRAARIESATGARTITAIATGKAFEQLKDKLATGVSLKVAGRFDEIANDQGRIGETFAVIGEARHAFR